MATVVTQVMRSTFHNVKTVSKDPQNIKERLCLHVMRSPIIYTIHTLSSIHRPVWKLICVNGCQTQLNSIIWTLLKWCTVRVLFFMFPTARKMLLENTFSTLRNAASSYCGLTWTKINQNKRDVSHRARFCYNFTGSQIGIFPSYSWFCLQHLCITQEDLYSCAHIHIGGWRQMVMTVVTVKILINSTLH